MVQIEPKLMKKLEIPIILTETSEMILKWSFINHELLANVEHARQHDVWPDYGFLGSTTVKNGPITAKICKNYPKISKIPFNTS